MPCYRPTFVVRDRSGHYDFTRDYRVLHSGEIKAHLNCRHCLGCREATARDWSVRNFHHALTVNEDWEDPDTHVRTSIPDSCVITLTYDSEHLPADGQLDHSHFQRFMKRLRKHLSGHKLSYFMCGEYGGKTNRAHFHSIIYGTTFPDRYEEIDRTGKITKMSYTLDRLWSQPAYKNGPSTQIGRASVDDFSYSGASYVAGYVAKKSLVEGHNGPEDWAYTPATANHPATWQMTYLAPEYRHMSRNLGKQWLLANLDSVYPDDAVYIGKYRFQPPDFYDRLLRKQNLELYDQVKLGRFDGAEITAREWTPERCFAAETVHMAKLQQRSDSL